MSFKIYLTLKDIGFSYNGSRKSSVASIKKIRNSLSQEIFFCLFNSNHLFATKAKDIYIIFLEGMSVALI